MNASKSSDIAAPRIISNAAASPHPLFICSPRNRCPISTPKDPANSTRPQSVAPPAVAKTPTPVSHSIVRKAPAQPPTVAKTKRFPAEPPRSRGRSHPANCHIWESPCRHKKSPPAPAPIPQGRIGGNRPLPLLHAPHGIAPSKESTPPPFDPAKPVLSPKAFSPSPNARSTAHRRSVNATAFSTNASISR